VKDVMIRVENIFMLPADTTLDFDTMAEIEYQGEFEPFFIIYTDT